MGRWVPAVMLVLFGVRAVTQAPAAATDDPRDLTNWASPSAGARFSAGANTEFLGDEDLRGMPQGRPVIFRHGPRGLEKVIVVEMARTVTLRAVTFTTGIDDWIRVPTGVDVSLSLTGEPDSFRAAGRANRVIAERTMVAIDRPTPARFVKLSFRDTSGGSRIGEIGAYSAMPSAVRRSVRGFDPPGPAAGRLTVEDARALVKRYGKRGDMDLTINCGGFDYAAPPAPGPGTVLARYMAEDSHLRRAFQHMRQDLPVFAALGVTAVETYTRWSLIEERKGVYDFSLYDAFERLLEHEQVKWVPLIILGPAYTVPGWYRSSPDYVPYRCLEHDRVNAVVSVWSPGYKRQVVQFLRAFGKHYRGRKNVQSVMLGISGIFGETQYPHDSVRDWTTTATGDYHSHFGWWAGDRYARADWKRYLAAKYRTDERLRAAWRDAAVTLATVEPRIPDTLPSRRARLDFLEWYTSNMTRTAELWLREFRRVMPHTRVELSVGGHGIPRVGTDFSKAARLCAKYHAGVRITNEGTDYRQNVGMTRWISAACRQYGAWLGIEPASVQIDRASAVHRAYNAATSGAEELFCYPSDLRNRAGYEALASSLRWLRYTRPIRSTAYWIPRTHLMCAGDTDFLGQMMSLREATDFDAVDSTMIRDGALSRYRVLVMGQGEVEEASVLRAIERWVRGGGTLVRVNDRPLVTVEGSTAYDARIFGVAGACRGEPRPGESFGEAVGRLLGPRAPLDPAVSRLPKDVFGVRTSLGALYLNLTPAPVTVHGVTVPPNGIAGSAAP